MLSPFATPPPPCTPVYKAAPPPKKKNPLLTGALLCTCRVDAETNKRLELERSIRELENKIEELTEDFDAEKASRTKAEKQRKEISEVCPP